MKKTILIARLSAWFCALFILILNVSAQEKTVTYYADPNKAPPDLAIIPEHIKANLSFQPSENRISGEAELTFFPAGYRTDSIVLYTPDFMVSKVTLKDQPCIFRRTGSSLIVYPPFPLSKGTKETLLICYESSPKNGPIYFVGWKPEEQGRRKQIWAHRPNGWLPYTEGRVTMDLYITFDKAFNVFANGERISVKENPDGTKTWNYRMTKDHPFFSTCLAIGDYEYASSRTNRNIPLEFLYYRGMEDRVKPTYQYTEQMFSFFEKEMGVPYPYPVYREIPVSDYMYGGMETTTSTIFGDYMLIDPRAYWQRNYINVNAHELAHQWYGDCIAHLAHKDVWLTESFGTYFAKMFEKSIFGADQYQNEMNNERNLALAAAARNNFPVGGTQGGVERIYQKGSLVLGMLRYVMGDREFLDAIRLYTERSLFTCVETSDFIRAVYDATGKSYLWFFDEWILKGGEPDYRVEYSVMDDTTGARYTVFTVTQVHETGSLTGLFRMPVIFEVHYADGTFARQQEWIQDKTHVIRVPNPDKKVIDYTLFDPGRNILKKVTFDKTVEELSAQALRAEHMIDRYDALTALRTVMMDKKRNILVTAFAQERFFLTKSEIIQQIAGDHTPESVALLLGALKDPDEQVRKAALLNIKPIPEMLQEAAETCLSDSSYLNAELALEALCRDFPGEKKRYLDLMSNEKGWRGMNIRMKWLEIAIGDGQKQYLGELSGYAGPAQDFEIRINAINLLRKLNYLDPVSAEHLIQASLHWNNKLSSAARDVLGYFSQQSEQALLIRTVLQKMNLQDNERSAVEQTLNRKSQ